MAEVTAIFGTIEIRDKEGQSTKAWGFLEDLRLFRRSGAGTGGQYFPTKLTTSKRVLEL